MKRTIEWYLKCVFIAIGVLAVCVFVYTTHDSMEPVIREWSMRHVSSATIGDVIVLVFLSSLLFRK